MVKQCVTYSVVVVVRCVAGGEAVCDIQCLLLSGMLLVVKQCVTYSVVVVVVVLRYVAGGEAVCDIQCSCCCCQVCCWW